MLTRYQCWLKWAGLREDHPFSTIAIWRHYGEGFSAWNTARLREWAAEERPEYHGSLCQEAYRWALTGGGDALYDAWLNRYVRTHRHPQPLTPALDRVLMADLAPA